MTHWAIANCPCLIWLRWTVWAYGVEYTQPLDKVYNQCWDCLQLSRWVKECLLLLTYCISLDGRYEWLYRLLYTFTDCRIWRAKFWLVKILTFNFNVWVLSSWNMHLKKCLTIWKCLIKNLWIFAWHLKRWWLQMVYHHNMITTIKYVQLRPKWQMYITKPIQYKYGTNGAHRGYINMRIELL